MYVSACLSIRLSVYRVYMYITKENVWCWYRVSDIKVLLVYRNSCLYDFIVCVVFVVCMSLYLCLFNIHLSMLIWIWWNSEAFYNQILLSFTNPQLFSSRINVFEVDWKQTWSLVWQLCLFTIITLMPRQGYT